MGMILEKLKGLFTWKGGRKKQMKKRRDKRAKGYSSPEAFHQHFKERYGKPGRIPEDV
jgi:hypothetical protein